MATATRYSGGCHCGAVRFGLEIGERVALECNCSICRKKGFLHIIVAAGRFHLQRGAEALVEYRFGTGNARHLFCRTCGISSYYVPRSHPDGFSVNLRCLDGDVAADFEIRPFDGRNWEDNVSQIRLTSGS
jgi:hypothetical protein